VKPLDGLLVLDFSRVLAGPMATMILAELGARVIKIEQPGAGDESRTWEPRVESAAGPESAYFFAVNRSKESITLNLRKPSARGLARRLALKADILIENFPTGTMAKFGLDAAALAADNPGLVYVSNTGFGQTGPYAERKGYDTIFQAMGGMMGLTGELGGGPVKAGLPTGDLTAGLWIVIAALTGVAGRTRAGHGCHIDLSMFDVQVSLLTIAAARYFALGEVPPRSGTEHPGRVPSASFRCRDGKYLHITGSDQHWAPLCKALKLDDLLADAALAKNAARVARREEVMRALSGAIAEWDRPALLAALDTVDVPAGPVNALDEVLADPQVAARAMVGGFDHPTVGAFRALGQPIKFAGFDNAEIGRPPLLGEHTELVLKRELGLTDAEIAALRQEEAL
jgi:crotonobetainyl-CoA:carnitine CoA-transferase CaiB-like acyl-CoA transferase